MISSSVNRGRRWLILGMALAATCLQLAGCGVKRRIEKGDKALLAGRPATAIEHYETALRRDRTLADDPAFTAKLRQARRQIPYDIGRVHFGRGRWREAIAAFEQSLRIDGTFTEASDALRQAKKRGAETLLKQALDAADAGKLNQAIELLKQAATLDPKNADIQDALRSVGLKKAQRTREAAKRFAEVQRLRDELRWKQAVAACEQVIALNPNHLPARVGRHDCTDALDAAMDHHRRGASLMAQRRLDEAIGAFDASLKIWPHHVTAIRFVAEARRLRAEVDDLLRSSRLATDRKQWDRAAALAKKAWDLYPWHAAVKQRYETAMQAAATDHLAKGRALAAKGPSKEAEKEMLWALRYVPVMHEARAALAALYEIRGDTDAAAGRHGSAMLWFAQAVEWMPTSRRRSRLAGARGRVLGRIRFGLDAAVADQARVPGGVGGLNAALHRTLGRKRPGFLAMGAGTPRYVASLTVTAVDIRKRRTGVEHRRHDYQIPREAPNPEIPNARLRVHAARNKLGDLIANRWEKCSWCDGKGWRDCSSCSGRGWRTCSLCRGRKSIECRTCKGRGRVKSKGRWVRCQVCHGDGRDNCPRCKRTAREPCTHCGPNHREKCSHCDGTGRRERHSAFEIDRQRGRVRRMRHALHALPITVTEYEDATWPYTVETFEKRAEIDVAIVVREGNREIYRHHRGVWTRQTDDRIIGANPAIGLAENYLYLPSDAAIAGDLFEGIAQDAAERIVGALLRHRIAGAVHRAASFRRDGKLAEAFEAEVDAVLLVEARDPAAARRRQTVLHASRKPAVPEITP